VSAAAKDVRPQHDFHCDILSQAIPPMLHRITPVG